MKKRSGLIVLAAFLAIAVSNADAQAAFFGKKDKKAQKTEETKSSAPQAEYSAYSASSNEYSAPAPTPAPAPAPAQARAAAPAQARAAAPGVKEGFNVAAHDPKVTGEEYRDRTSHMNRMMSQERDDHALLLARQGLAPKEIARKMEEFEATRDERMKQLYDKTYKKR